MQIVPLALSGLGCAIIVLVQRWSAFDLSPLLLVSPSARATTETIFIVVTDMFISTFVLIDANVVEHVVEAHATKDDELRVG